MRGSLTSAMPTSRPEPYSSENTPAGKPHSFTACATAWPTSSLVPGVGAVGLDHHWAASRQCRCGVATGHREGQREIAGAEHGYRPQGHLALAQVGARQGLAFWLGVVDPHIQPFTGPHYPGEGTQLGAGAATLALDARLGQAAFGHGAVDQGIAQRFDLRAMVSRNCARCSSVVSR